MVIRRAHHPNDHQNNVSSTTQALPSCLIAPPAPQRASPPPTLHPIRLVTHNIRYAATTLLPGESPWPTRRPHLCAALAFHTRHHPSALICLQEVLHDQLRDIIASLNWLQRDPPDDWTYIGVGRDDGRCAGEYAPIVYRASSYALLRWRTVWLSPTPDVPSRGWDAGSIRILTVAVLTHRVSGRDVVVMNTHLDNVGSRARREAARMIVERVRECGRGEGKVPVLLAGDLNSEVGDEAYEVLVEKESGLRDLRGFVDEEERYGHCDTFTGFEGRREDRQRIDFLFLGNEGREWVKEGYAVLENLFEDGVYLSDHRAVVGDVCLKS